MKSIFIESDLSSFEDFHDKEWLNNVYAIVIDTPIQELTEEFVLHWWGNARAFILPWLFVNGIYDSLTNIISLPIVKSRQDVWNEYINLKEFKVALWKLAENTYCSLYYAYENLIVNILNKILKANIRVTDRDFKKNLIDVFGGSFTNKIWNDNFIAVSREIRNCIVHNGGKESIKLLKMKSTISMKNGEIMISASDTRKLYETLKPLIPDILKFTIESLSIM